MVNHKETVGIIGLGKLGICFALNLERNGYFIIGSDINEQHVQSINSKTLTSHEPLVEEYLLNATDVHATTDIHSVLNSDSKIIFIAVATPSTDDGRYDHYQIDAVIKEIIAFGKQAETRTVVVMATTMPGYCDQVASELETLNYHVVYNPGFVAQGAIIEDQQDPGRVLIGGVQEAAIKKVKEVYVKMSRNLPVFCEMNRLSAEICKIASNCFLTSNPIK